MDHIASLQPVLAAILASKCSRSCSTLIKHLEDRLLHILARCLNALLKPWGRRIIKVNPEDREAIREVLSPYKKEVVMLARRNVSIARKRRILNQTLRKYPEFHEVLAGIAKTLNEIIESKLKKENGERKSG